MTSAHRQILWITVAAVAAFFGLRSLPDTQCAFLHADHQPVVSQGVAFCGVNEEANFYSPQALRFPVKLELDFAADRMGARCDCWAKTVGRSPPTPSPSPTRRKSTSTSAR